MSRNDFLISICFDVETKGLCCPLENVFDNPFGEEIKAATLVQHITCLELAS